MKRFTAALATVLVLLSALSGCSKKTAGRPFDYDLSKYITLGEYTGMEYTYSVQEVTPEAVTEFINSAMSEKGYGSVEQITDRPVKTGDTVNIAFVGRVDGKEFEKGSTDSYDLEIGSNAFIEGFESGLIGVNKGETKVLNLTFPEDYGKDELNGKPVEFTVTVNSIKTTVYPELTDEIVKDISDKETVAEYKEYANQQVAINNEKTATENKEGQIWQQVVQNVTVSEYPEQDLKWCREMVLARYDQVAQSNYGCTYEEYLSKNFNKTLKDEDIAKEIDTQAQGLVKEYMTIVAIARAQGLDVEGQEYQQKLEETAKSNGYNSADEFLEAVDEGQFYLSLLVDNVMDFLVENAVEKA